MGGQNTAACANATTPTPIPTINICPDGWRLPTGEETTGEFTTLNTAINGGSSISDASLRSVGLFQYTGSWSTGFLSTGSSGSLWSSFQNSATNVHRMDFSSALVYPAASVNKFRGIAIRCIAQ